MEVGPIHMFTNLVFPSSPALVLSQRNLHYLHKPRKAWHAHESLERMARVA